ncbi:MAG: SurA N-terminal domain-containing protein [Thermodesulfovibrionales bacterium]
MLKSMRKHARYFYVLFVLVILSFIFWGVGGVDNDTSTAPVATIGEDEKITLDEYWRTYERVLDLYREIYKEKLDPEKMKLKEQVLESLLEDRVLYLAARDAGIAVSDAELQSAITSNPAFMRDGFFNRQIYLRSLELNRMTPAQYEGAKRREMMVEKMKNLVRQSVDLSPAEIEKAGKDEALRNILLDSKRQAALDSFVQGLKTRLNVKVNYELIS